ncbi:hypothetical protein L2E82_12911 [Cichorium intybus]|uniref:Uncharacterized protein n=1 Tax=Cichorium intybus TaxID=13427 RepID=A0ACB9GIH6_CICIN|nr:hypothetical protein L2E82_12911 [Cichorium intybus]
MDNDSSDISGELQRLVSFLEESKGNDQSRQQKPEPEPWEGFLQRENFLTEICTPKSSVTSRKTPLTTADLHSKVASCL